MADFDYGGDPPPAFGDDDDDDDIARFERECAARARAEGGAQLGQENLETIPSDDEADESGPTQHLGGVSPSGPSSSGPNRALANAQEKLRRREAELSQLRGDMDLLRTEVAPTGPNDAVAELKKRLVDLTKKSRSQQVTMESQKSRIKSLEAELQKPRAQAKKQADELAAQNMEAMLGDGVEDWKKKYLYTSNKLQEVRHEVQDVRAQLQRHKKVLLKELGSDEMAERALAVADDPTDVQWRGRATQITQLQRQVKELKEQLRKGAPGEDLDSMGADNDEMDTPQRPRRQRVDPIAEKQQATLAQAADRRREEFEKAQDEAERMRSEAAEAKRKRDALKTRAGMLEGQLRDLKAHVQTLVQKSENDDELVAAMRRQLGRPGVHNGVSEADEDAEALKSENAELQSQLERQAQIILQLRQKSLANSCEAGSARLGPRSAEPGTPTSALVERVRFLEAENARQSEQVKLMKERRLSEDQRPGSGTASCRSLSAGGGDTEQLLRANEALKREVLRLRASAQASGAAYSPTSSRCSEDGG